MLLFCLFKDSWWILVFFTFLAIFLAFSRRYYGNSSKQHLAASSTRKTRVQTTSNNFPLWLLKSRFSIFNLGSSAPPRGLPQSCFYFIMSSRGSYAHPPPTKTVIVFRNGDAFYPGRKFVINQRQSSTFDSFLNTVTRGITAHFGAVRNIYTPNKGHRVANLEQLVHGEIYVAAGAERLKKME